jgi:polysaccharide biosynthesis transport protein
MTQGPMDLRDYLATLWRRKWTIAALATTTTVVALFLARDQVPVYTSTTHVLVKAARFDPTQPSAAFGFINMKTEEQVANSPAVAGIALQQLADRRVQPGTVTGSVPEGTETILFSASSPDPAAAQATAQAYADAYLEFRGQDVHADLQAARDELNNQLDDIQKSLESTSQQLRNAQTQGAISLFNSLFSGLQSRQTTVQAKLTDLPTSDDLHVGSILENAALPDSPSSSSRRNTIILGLLVGLALGVSVALFRDRLDEGVRGRDDLEIHSRAPVLAFIPHLAARNGSPITLADPTSDGAEAYKALRVRVLLAAERQGIRSVLITSAVAGEGKTSTTANLGVALAQMGKSVVLISADLRRPRLHEYFPASNGTGLTDVLEGRSNMREALSVTGTKDLWVLHAGLPRPLPDQLDRLGSASMRDLLDELKEAADFILVDAPPILSVSDATALATLTDGVLMVVDPRRVQTPTVNQARVELEQVGANVIGVVVNNYDPRRFRQYSNRYRYSYGPDQGSSPFGRPSLPAAAERVGAVQSQSGDADGGATEEPS